MPKGKSQKVISKKMVEAALWVFLFSFALLGLLGPGTRLWVFDFIPSFLFGLLGYWLFYIIPLAIFIVLFIIYRRQIAENANVIKMKNKKANKVALKRMKEAGKLLANSNSDQFYDEVLKALWGYTSDKLNIPSSLLSKDNIEGQLQDHQVPQEVIKEFIDIHHSLYCGQ